MASFMMWRWPRGRAEAGAAWASDDASRRPPRFAHGDSGLVRRAFGAERQEWGGSGRECGGGGCGQTTRLRIAGELQAGWTVVLIGRGVRAAGPGVVGFALGVIGLGVIGVSVTGADVSVGVVRVRRGVIVVRPGVESGSEGLEEERGDAQPEGQWERSGGRDGAAHGSDQPDADCC